MELMKIGYVGYESPTYKAMEEYGPSVFGFGLNDTADDDTVLLTMDDAFFRVAVHPGETTRVAYIGWEAKDKFCFEDCVEKLRRAGVAVTVGDEELEARRGVFGVAQFRDPLGWPHEVYYAQQIRPHSFRPGRGHRGFATSRYGMHVVLNAARFEDIEDFCRRMMGLNYFGTGSNRKDTGSFWRPRNSVLSHSIAYLRHDSHTPGDTSAIGMQHMAFYCTDDEDVGVSYDLVKRRKQHVFLDIGKHGPDPVLSFYSVTPAGFVVECVGPPLEMPDEGFVQQAIPGAVWGMTHTPIPAAGAPDSA